MAKGIVAVDKNNPQWYAVHTRFKWEKKAEGNLLEAGIETYLPLQEKIKKYEKVTKRTYVPVITNYIFVRIVQTEYVKVLQQEGVLGFLHNHGQLRAIPDIEMEALKQMVEHLDLDSVEVVEGIWEKGTPITIVSGPLAGHIGKVVEEYGTKKIIVSLASMNHSFKIVLDKKHSIIG